MGKEGALFWGKNAFFTKRVANSAFCHKEKKKEKNLVVCGKPEMETLTEPKEGVYSNHRRTHPLGKKKLNPSVTTGGPTPSCAKQRNSPKIDGLNQKNPVTEKGGNVLSTKGFQTKRQIGTEPEGKKKRRSYTSLHEKRKTETEGRQ